ncbi:uncharacterized protein LOC142587967 [Dermacentor variabilis]|uniref:uncharacterized protein LOC142587967 n=1 Tax=Dermacentor variabilis TaxID=34621 RepID=UPI003F5C319D
MLVSINEKLEYLLPLKKMVESIEDTVQFTSEQYDELLTRIEKNEREVKKLKHRIEKVEAKDSEMMQLKTEVDDLEWRSRKLKLEFHGIKPVQNENLLVEINKLTVLNNLPQLLENDILATHHLPSKTDKTPGIICRFANQAIRNKWWQSRKKLSSENDNVFLSENLTKRTRALLFETKLWAKTNNYKYVYKVLVRETDRANAVVISNSSNRDKTE